MQHYVVVCCSKLTICVAILWDLSVYCWNVDDKIAYMLIALLSGIRFENLAVPGVPSNDTYLYVYTFLMPILSLFAYICTCVMTSKDSLAPYGPTIMKTATHQTSGGVWELKYSKNLRIKCSILYCTVFVHLDICHVYGS